MSSGTISSWLARGDLEKLERVVLDGQGERLLNKQSTDIKTQVFLKGIPNYLSKIDQIHDAVTVGNLEKVQKIVSAEPKKNLIFAKDPSGTPLLHKAVYYGRHDIIEYILKNFPNTCSQKDQEGRTALHYCVACKAPEFIWELLIQAGCDARISDKKNRTASYYLEHANDIQLTKTESTNIRRSNGENSEYPDFKSSNIRIWIHNRDIGKLQRVLWEGHGSKLRCETSSNPRIRKFLEATPFIMGTIKNIHNAVVKKDFPDFLQKIAHPVPAIILSSKDKNGLNVLHKAAGLGYLNMIHEIIDRYPASINASSNDGKIPLHYAAAVADKSTTYNCLVQYGADENKLDNKNKNPAYYKLHPGDIDHSKLFVIPDAPRQSGLNHPKDWDWGILNYEATKSTKKTRGDTNILSKSAQNGQRRRKTPTSLIPKPENTNTKLKLVNNYTTMNHGITMNQIGTNTEESKVFDLNAKKADSPDGEFNTENNERMLESRDYFKNIADFPAEEIADIEPYGNDLIREKSNFDKPTNANQIIAGKYEELVEAVSNDRNMFNNSELKHSQMNGDIERYATLVLNGEGKHLVGYQSNDPEIQGFINSIPSYMKKIHTIHVAARNGNLKELQRALDRRKFAVAKDEISPHGATPLHVAIIFGHTAIIRYLAGRFPETLYSVDTDGRTPLHYASTLADDGYHFNLLLGFGGNPLILDNLNRKAEYYQENQTDFTHRNLLKDFGALQENVDEMLTDKEVSNPVTKSSTEVVPSQFTDPQQYQATYFFNFASGIQSRGETQKSDNQNYFDSDQKNEDIDVDQSQNTENSNNSDSVIESPLFSSANRDEHGQSMLHFAAVRTRPKDALFHMIQETEINIGLRDELYRTARDVAEESNFWENVEDIDRYVVYLAARGETKKLVELLLEGYDHILDAEDAGVNVVDIAAERNCEASIQFLQSVPVYLAQRDEVHRAIRSGDLATTHEILTAFGDGANLLAVGKNTLGRCTLHIAVLGEHVHIVEYLARTYNKTLEVGDNLERTALHYAMGLPSVEVLSGILIKAGAKRVRKDLKARQPSYYFMNKADVQRLQEEEQTIAK